METVVVRAPLLVRIWAGLMVVMAAWVFSTFAPSVFAVLPVALGVWAWRAGTVSATATMSGVVVRNLLRTHRFSRDRVARITAQRRRVILSWGVAVVDNDGGRVWIDAVEGYYPRGRRTQEAVAARLRAALHPV